MENKFFPNKGSTFSQLTYKQQEDRLKGKHEIPCILINNRFAVLNKNNSKLNTFSALVKQHEARDRKMKKINKDPCENNNGWEVVISNKNRRRNVSQPKKKDNDGRK